MSEAKHTPGPWEYWPAQNYVGFSVAPKVTLTVLDTVERCGHMCNVNVHNFPGSTEANAQLIAAAPAMLSALKEAHDYFAKRNIGEPAQRLQAKLADVISKATS